MSNPLSRVICLLLLVASCSLLPACDRSEQTPPPADSPAKLRVGYIPVTHCLPLYCALHEGYFTDRNLEVELVSLPGGAKILEALAAKDIDVGFSNVVSLILARSEGLPFVSFTGGPVEDASHRDHALLVRSDSPIQSVSELRGKTLAINSRRNIDHLMILLLLQEHGLTEKDVTIVEVPFPRMLCRSLVQ
jgi:NitT/TauT family transport system substrate-binding protein